MGLSDEIQIFLIQYDLSNLKFENVVHQLWFTKIGCFHTFNPFFNQK